MIAAASAWVCFLAEGPPDDDIGRRPQEGIDMEVLFERVAGLDIGKASLTVCVRTPGPRDRRSQKRTYPTTTRALAVMRDWLLANEVSIAAMESTST